STATLTGSINPEGQDTSYFFQYGPTKAYGSQTALADAGAGRSNVRVSLAISGLQPITRYHYRLIAVNAAGAKTAGDGFFTTTKVPLSLAIITAPNPVSYGGNVLVQGTLSGTGNGGVGVVLQASPFPYLQGFVNVGNPQLTNASGGFSLPVLGLTTTTHFRIATLTNNPVLSPVVIQYVAVTVSSHVGRTARHGFVRIFGTVTPAENGAHLAILKIAHGHGVLVAGAVLRYRSPSTSKFSRVVHVTRGVYRVLVVITSGAQASSYGQPLLIR
ncbi:MAG: hypothetical protein M3Z95_00400, partial [Actinomycetota bacterium]|nr:hypothetical protein [Actinomycetota bacterium]